MNGDDDTDARNGASRGRDAVIAEQIALLEAKHGALLVDLQEWALTSPRNEQAHRNYLRFLASDALNRSSEIKLSLTERL